MTNTPEKIYNFLNEKRVEFVKQKLFKSTHPFSKRKEESSRILAKYTNRIPVICECVSNDIPNVDKKKFLVPSDLTMAQFLYVIRKRIKISSEKSIYLFINGNIVAGSQIMGSVYEMHKDEDGFLYICYSGENTFGMPF